MKRKLLTIVLALVILVSIAACDKHTHEYGEWVVEKAATCTETGKKYRECDCGDRQYEDIPALGHNFVDGVCTVCGATE